MHVCMVKYMYVTFYLSGFSVQKPLFCFSFRQQADQFGISGTPLFPSTVAAKQEEEDEEQREEEEQEEGKETEREEKAERGGEHSSDRPGTSRTARQRTGVTGTEE